MAKDEALDIIKKYAAEFSVDFDAGNIKNAFRKLTMKTHPDKYPDEQDRYTQIFQELSSAYFSLADE
jgi:DnaJ-class molecular chaperone